MFPVISIGDTIEIPLYSILFFIGVIIAVLIGRRWASSVALPKEDILYGTVYAFIGIVIGAKLLFLITKLPSLVEASAFIPHSFHDNFWGTLLYLASYLLGGYVYYGGLIGAIFGLFIYCRKYKVDFISYIDIFAPMIPLVHGFGRIGCFCAGCCYGIEYHGFGSVHFPYNKFNPQLDDVSRVPVQLIEASLNFIFFFVMVYLFRKKEWRGGKLLGIYLLYYALARIGLEMLRGDPIRGSIGFLSTSQIISLVLIPIGIVLAKGTWLSQKYSLQKGVTNYDL